jgi:hypothetical protein
MQMFLMTFKSVAKLCRGACLFLRMLPLLLLTVVSAQAGAENCQAVQERHGEDVISVHCGGAPSAAFDTDGKLWVTFVQDQHVYVATSDDMGATYETPVQVNRIAEDAEHNGENRPKIIVAPNGHVLLSWTTKTSSSFTGEIRFTRSTDGGKTYIEPRTINDDGLFTGHRFDSLFLTQSGQLFLTWIDKRDLEASAVRNENYPGAAIYYAVSEDLGRSFAPNVRVSHNSCECCRIAVAPHGDDKIAILWRQIFEEHIRDHAIAVLSADGEVSDLNRATVDDWFIDACPHHGPAMVTAEAQGQYHIAWFSAGNLHSGIHYGRYDLGSRATSNIFKVDATPGAGHPDLAVFNSTLYIVWKGFNGTASQLRMMTSQDDGRSWSEPETLFDTQSASDHPLLLTSPTGVYLSWSTQEYGYIFHKISQGPAQ